MISIFHFSPVVFTDNHRMAKIKNFIFTIAIQILFTTDSMSIERTTVEDITVRIDTESQSKENEG